MRKNFVGWDNIRAWGEAHPEIVTGYTGAPARERRGQILGFCPRGAARRLVGLEGGKGGAEYLYSGRRDDCLRRGFQRVYDLRERVLPGWNDARVPPYEDALRSWS
jgi:hypothetical protein